MWRIVNFSFKKTWLATENKQNREPVFETSSRQSKVKKQYRGLFLRNTS